MSFSKAQQPAYRLMVAAAWKAHCQEHEITGKMDDAWYRAQLRVAVGEETTTACDKGRDYDLAMAHFEALSRDGIRWQMKVFRGDANRIFHNLETLCEDYQLSEEYLQRIARQALRVEQLPELHTLDKDALLVVLRAAKQYVTRRLVADGRREPQRSRPPGGFLGPEKKPQVKAYLDAKMREVRAEFAAQSEADSEADENPF